MSGGPGYGRGGRGAALLQALNAPVRRPGAAETSPKPAETAAATSAPLPPKPLGRGLAMSLALKQGAQAAPVAPPAATAVAPAPTPAPTPTPAPVAAAQPLQPAAQPSAQPSAMPAIGGRGAALGRARALQDLLKKPLPAGGGRGAVIAALSPSASTLSSPARSTPIPASPQPSVQTTPTPAPSAPAPAPAPAPAQAPEAPPTEAGQGDRRLTKLEYMLQRMSCEEPVVSKPGKMGQKVPMVANYIPVRCSKEGQYQYAVSFNPDVHSKNMRFKLLYAQAAVIGETRNFDGSILFLPHKLPQAETVINTNRPTDGEAVTIKIKLVKVLPPEQCIQLYNVLFRNIMKILKYVEVNRHDYDPHFAAKIPQHRLEVWPGYVTALSRYEGGLMINVDVSHKVLRTQTAYELIEDLHSKSRGQFKDEVARELTGSVVMTRYNNKTYRVDDIDWSMSPASSFSLTSGENITFQEYYLKHYNKEIRDPRQPLLVHRPKKREREQGGRAGPELILLVPELCYLTGLSDNMRADFKVMKDLATHTRVSPAQRQLAMRKYCENVNSHPEARKELAKWGLELDMDCVNLMGRKLGEEKIFLGKGGSVMAGPRADWSRAATGRNAMLHCVELRNWCVVCTQRNAGITADAVVTLVRCAKEMGMTIAEPPVFKLQTDRTEEYVRVLREKVSEDTQLVMMIMPTSRDDRYNAVKKLLCCERPVPSQVINAKTISRKDKLRSVCQKVVLQINCKLGGTLWGVAVPREINSKEAGGLMVVGIDVYHDKGSGQSCAAIVCSTDTTITRYYSEVIFQASRKELIEKICPCFTHAVSAYYKANHMLPGNIIVFRDGVGDGDMGTVRDFEVDQFQRTFSSFGETYKPKFAEIVVQKRINTRMFMRRGEGRNATLENPPPGSVLDHTVTRRDAYDFFIVSQHVTQGTVTPTHYVVVKDWPDWPADWLQKVTYQMCHLYYNWPGTIRVPAPCQYAHKLAQLAGMNLRSVPAKSLNNRLFYL